MQTMNHSLNDNEEIQIPIFRANKLKFNIHIHECNLEE